MSRILLLLLLPAIAVGQPQTYDELVTHVQQRVVKLYGASLGLEKGYASGVLVGADGLILTNESVLLESPALRVVLPDGRRLAAEVARRDSVRQLALLKVEATDLPYFELQSSADLQTGQGLIAAGNPFKVAAGPEPVSVSLGILSGRTQLQARKRSQTVRYQGEVLLTDMIVSTPGYAGGALVDLQGNLVGLIGKPATSTRTNTWLNYALPSDACLPLIRGEELPEVASAVGEDGVARARAWGIRLFDVGGQVRLAYVERVTPGSPARLAGVRYGDLVLSVAGNPVETCSDFYTLAGRTTEGAPVELLLKRGEDVLPVTLEFGGGPQ